MRTHTITLFLALLLFLTSVSANAQNQQVESFHHAKRHLAIIHEAHPVTLYSGCAYKGKAVDDASCSYIPAKSGSGAKRVEWEHVVPAETFGRTFAEWREGHPDCVDRHGKPFRGRHCAAKVNLEYRRVEADMYNLFPELGDLKARRSSQAMGQVAKGDGIIDTGHGKIGGGAFEPPDNVKGDIARTYLYMDAAYPHLRLVSDQKRQLFQVWSASDPVDAWECERAARIAQVQGNINEFVARHCDTPVQPPPT